MKIGLLAYHAASNFGARLQILSTYLFLKNLGHNPVIINWIPKSLEKFYDAVTPYNQKECLRTYSEKFWTETSLCRTSIDIAEIICKDNIEAVIIGSDAVAQNHPTHLAFPTRRIISLSRPTEDRCYPNPFWADFLKYLPQRIPIALMSVSSQDSPYKNFKKDICSEMYDSILEYKYFSVRDTWTQQMMSYISNGEVEPPITPDPVFAFNYNAASIIPTKEEIMHRFNLPEKYFVLSFLRKPAPNQKWIALFASEAKKEGIETILLPFSYKNSIGKLTYIINLPLSPLDWYAIIKYSCGYIGHNMHPIVISIANGVPFFSFDNYGLTKFSALFSDDSSSKILHILTKAGLTDYRVSCLNRFFKPPKVNLVLKMLLTYNNKNALNFSETYYREYKEMMFCILKSFLTK